MSTDELMDRKMDAGQNKTKIACYKSFQLTGTWIKKNTRKAGSIIIMFISCTQSSNISFETFIFLMHKLHRVL